LSVGNAHENDIIAISLLINLRRKMVNATSLTVKKRAEDGKCMSKFTGYGINGIQIALEQENQYA
jgi:hypothetical protein